MITKNWKKVEEKQKEEQYANNIVMPLGRFWGKGGGGGRKIWYPSWTIQNDHIKTPNHFFVGAKTGKRLKGRKKERDSHLVIVRKIES